MLYHLRNSETDLALPKLQSTVALWYGTTIPKRLKKQNLYGSLRRVSALSVPDSELCIDILLFMSYMYTSHRCTLTWEPGFLKASTHQHQPQTVSINDYTLPIK